MLDPETQKIIDKFLTKSRAKKVKTAGDLGKVVGQMADEIMATILKRRGIKLRSQEDGNRTRRSI